jgi:hypothetical protein
MSESSPFTAALLRGLIIGVLTGVLTTLTTWSQTSDTKTLIIAGGTAAITTFLARSGLEGGYDTRRQSAGDVHASDVHAVPPPGGPVPSSP